MNAFMALAFLLAVLFPEQLLFYTEKLELNIKIVLMDINLFIRSYLIYRKLKADSQKMNFDLPQFYYTRIQDRN